MTGDITVFHKYTPCLDNTTVRIADGTLSKAVGIGSVIISNDIVLKSVLFVPNLDCNLLSISKITRDLNCVTKFLPNVCVFQVSSSERTIGNARLCAGLYLLRANDPKNKTQKSSFVSFLDKNKKSAEMLWHYKLAHPNFLYLRKLFPFSFNKSEKFLHCEICQLSKHTRSSYQNQTYKPSYPFLVIHSDVWEPSKINNITGSRWFIIFIDDHTRITWTFLMKEKSEVRQIFQNFNNMI